jgi:kynurenine formamidase
MPRRFTTAVDLTHVMSPVFPTFFGVPGIELQKQFDIKKDGFNLNWWRIVEHAGTHLDAPLHFSADGRRRGEDRRASELVVPLAGNRRACRGRAESRLSADRSPICSPGRSGTGRIAGWLLRGDAVGLGKLRRRCTPNTPARTPDGAFHFPGFAPAAAEWLIKERKVAGIAVDTLSLDNGRRRTSGRASRVAVVGPLGPGERRQSRQVPPAGATLVVGLAKVKDATGAPARLFALV